MQTEKMRTPSGSKRFFPVGYFKPRSSLFAAKSAPQMMSVDRKSRAESTKEANSDIEFERTTAPPLETSSKMFTSMFTS